MSPFLEMLYDAPIGYNGAPFGPESDYVKQARIKCGALEALMAQLTQEQKDLFETFSDANGEIEEIRDQRKFTYGFHLGALLMLEIWQGNELMCG